VNHAIHPLRAGTIENLVHRRVSRSGELTDPNRVLGSRLSPSSSWWRVVEVARLSLFFFLLQRTALSTFQPWPLESTDLRREPRQYVQENSRYLAVVQGQSPAFNLH